MMYRRLAERYLDELGRIVMTGTMGWRWQMARGAVGSFRVDRVFRVNRVV